MLYVDKLEGFKVLYRKLGSSGLEVSVLGFGCWPVGNDWTEANDKSSVETIREAMELGINFFDVAPVYGFGHAEKVLGEAIKGKRDQIYIASKCGLRWDDSKTITRNLSRESILEEVDLTLQRLDIEYLDLYQLHWPDPNTPLEETISTLNELKEKGKIRNIGLSNYNVFLIKEAKKYGEIVSDQVLYNMIDRNSDHYHDLALNYRTEAEILPYAENNNLGVIPYSPLCQGLLTASFEIEKLDNGDVRTANSELRGKKLQKNLKKAAEVRQIAKDLGKPMVQLVLNWMAAKKGISTIIAGPTNVEEVRENVRAFDWELKSEVIEKIDEILQA
ncbi:aldo/keto reductase [Iocasia frigidifontis]|uniref:Aldo/keto reductase n=1 Tax=Iocasia fonsfrigidae TaxID=2682810 RepID=A0A8A7K7Z7_9FIRM|nr:aldo/keto reductase [Iocasia fonsfrigidae]